MYMHDIVFVFMHVCFDIVVKMVNLCEIYKMDGLQVLDMYICFRTMLKSVKVEVKKKPKYIAHILQIR